MLISLIHKTHSCLSKLLLISITSIAVITSPAVFGVDEDLFAAAVAVDPETEQGQQIRLALDTVLIKLVGARNAVIDPRLSTLRSDPQAHLISFSYQEQLIPNGEFGERQTILNAQFNRRQILAELQRQGVDLWSLERPEILLWLAIEDDQRQRDMLAGDDRLHRFVLEQTARLRGLPLVLPVQDQTDYSLVDADAIWGGFYENAELASQRYATDRFVIAAASQRNQIWQVRWRLPDNESGLETFVSRGPDLPAALAEGMHLLADRIAADAMVASSSNVSQTVRVVLQNIQSPAQYAVATRVFKNMSQVREVTLLQAQADDIELMLALSAPRRWLLQAIRLSDELSVDSSAGDPSTAAVLRVNVARQ